MGKFVHLHVHSEYSLLDGAARITKLVEKTRELGMNAIAVTDHGNMHGIVHFYKEAVKQGIKPIIGCEVYIAARKLNDKEPGIDKNQFHLLLLAENNEGYKNLIKIVSKGYVDGYYYKPRVDMEVLREYSGGIIASSACLAGEVQTCLLEKNYSKAVSKALEYREIFGNNNFFLELQDHGIPEQKEVNSQLIKISEETGMPLIITNDVHYINKEDAKFHDVLLCIQTGKKIDEDRMKFPTEEFYLKNYEEMMINFRDMEEAAANTVRIAQRCNVSLDFDSIHLPEYIRPEGYISNYEYLEYLCRKGLEKRYEIITPEISQRLDYELETIKNMGYVDYFLIVWDFIKYAKDNKIMVGPGRGSAAGSIVAYALEIIDIDPLRFNLIFERFLNPERITMPDIDIDFCYERREEVIEYVIKKYGSDRVAQIVTFGTMAARGAVRDVGRVLDMPYSQVDMIAKKIPMEPGISIKNALEKNSELNEMYENDMQVMELLDIAKKVEGLPRHTSTHAAGVVVSKLPVTEYVPLSRSKDVITTQFNMTELEELGLLKMDFLGLRTLTVIRDAAELIRKSRNKDISFEKCDYDDEKVYELFSRGETLGIFQFESPGMRNVLKDMKPDCFENIVAANALFRPGPMEQIPDYVRNKNEERKISYLHPKLESVLKVTYGCIVYQEQVMQIFREIAGFSMGRSDLVRRAMGKKKMEVMEKEREYFIYGKSDSNGNMEIPGAVKNGLSQTTAGKIYDLMINFAKYAFNKSHSAAYAALAYETAWLKVYYPVEFMAALISSIMNSTGSVTKYINECRRLGIKVLPPDINESESKFIVTENKIRFGLAAVKNVGQAAIDEIVRTRNEKGIFVSFSDFCEKVESCVLNKRQIESLIKCGAFDSMNIRRSQLMAVYENVLEKVHKDRKNKLEGQLSLFGNSEEFMPDDEYLPDIEEYDKKNMLLMERETMGIYISGHPLSEHEEYLRNIVTINSSDITEFQDNRSNESSADDKIYDGAEVIIGGIVSSRQHKITKNNKSMAFISLEDLDGEIEVIVFPDVYQKYRVLTEPDTMVIIKGKLSFGEDELPKVISTEIKRFSSETPKKIYLKINSQKDCAQAKKDIYRICSKYEGSSEIIIYMEESKNKLKINDILADCENNLMEAELKECLGSDNVVIK